MDGLSLVPGLSPTCTQLLMTFVPSPYPYGYKGHHLLCACVGEPENKDRMASHVITLIHV